MLSSALYVSLRLSLPVQEQSAVVPNDGRNSLFAIACREWRDALLKMKIGGINIATSYSFWIHHEETKGEWDFSGCRNLRLFVETVKD